MGLLDTLSEFISPEAGQRRRAALDRVDQRINDALGYYLGPQLAPRVQQAANLGGLLSPGQDVVDAYQASGDMMAPERGLIDRAASGAALAGALGAMFMPGGVSSIRQGVEDVADAAVRAYDPATTNAFTVWHGSPHDFDRFDMSKIGTGEGAQAYGHGLYFAESPDVARTYRHMRGGTVSPEAVRALRDMDYLGFSSAGEAATAIKADPNWRMAWDVQPEDAANADIIDGWLNSRPGAIYEVSIDANPEDFLDWDKPLSAQPEGVRNILGNNYRIRETDDGKFEVLGATAFGDAPIVRYGSREAAEDYIRYAEDGRHPAAETQHLVKTNDPASVSQRLREAGIPGIRYLDAGSRGAGEGSRNYVVFNDQLLSILNKYGLAGGAALGLGLLAAPSQSQAEERQGLLQ